MSEAKLIKNMQDLCDTFYADEPAMLNKRIYKGTDCGASISVYLEDYDTMVAIHNGDPAWRNLTMDTLIHSFTIQTIVEGSDATVDSKPFILPVDKDEVWKFVEYMESEAEMLWVEANEYDEEEM